MNPDTESAKQVYPPQEQPVQTHTVSYQPGWKPQRGLEADSYLVQQSNPTPNQADAPPTYNDVGIVQPQQPQQTHSVVVVQQQPTAVVHTTTVSEVGDGYLTLSIVLTILCVLCLSWYTLICVIPALVLSINARSAGQRGDIASARSLNRISLRLNIAAIASWVTFVVLYIVLVFISAANNNSNSSTSRQ